MNTVFMSILSLSLSASLLTLLLIAIKPLYKNRLSKTWQYYIWLIILLRFILPISLTPFNNSINPIGKLFSYTGYTYLDNETPQASNEAGLLPQEKTPPAEWASDAPSASFQKPVSSGANLLFLLSNSAGLIWVAAALLLLIRKLTVYTTYTRFMKASSFEITDPGILAEYHLVSNFTGIKKPPALFMSRISTAPMLLGILRPFIVMPVNRPAASEISCIMYHELIHFKRGDLIYKWLMQLILCLHWFNPLVYYISREIKTCCELSCDEGVIRNMSPQEKQQYGSTLLAFCGSTDSYNEEIASLTLSEDGKQLKRRLETIINYRKTSLPIAIVSFLLVLFLTGCGLALGSYTPSPSNPVDRLTIDEASKEPVPPETSPAPSQEALDPVQDPEASSDNSNSPDVTPSQDAANTILFKNQFSYAGIYTENDTMYLSEDTVVSVSVAMNAEKGELSFSIRPKGKVTPVYTANGNSVSEEMNLNLSAGTYFLTVKGVRVTNAQFNILLSSESTLSNEVPSQ